ncbi:hypothetical protein HA052_10970 [Chromobacterium haemolyticum]|uniref:Uncharacterized protein n=1 Tax=Chromobacterium fluminis TaxID=3044269 RepID=A0ABX0L818_9NEIS|nr:hypothetical protein [Chromobacterium haemolyticum]NHR05721.1 hypothetical protein [Chromobacterium haemolyticum]OQS41124.1 hypothetical protein B0T39_09185 [Chromobacterium haemolyticum]
MSNVITFPSHAARDWAGIERLLREVILEGGGDQDLFGFVVRRLKADYHALAQTLPVPVPDGMAEAAETINAFHQENTAKLLFSLSKAYIELYQHGAR